MSKYEPLWIWIEESGEDSLTLSFSQIKKILGFSLDHSLLTYKRELKEYGYVVGKVYMKEQVVSFMKL